MASEEKLGEISRALSHSIERMDNMQSRKAVPLFSRLRQHFSTQSGNITSVILAGCVLAVAAGRLNLKQEHQVHFLHTIQDFHQNNLFGPDVFSIASTK